LTVPLSAVAEVVRGVTFDKGEALDTAWSDAVPVLRAGNIADRLVTDHDLVWVPRERVSAEQRMRSGDIAICMSSGSPAVVGKSALLSGCFEGSVGAFCAILRPDVGRVVPEYLSFFLRSERFRSWTRQSSGSAIKNIRKSELEAFALDLPDLDEQRRVVDLLARAEGIVRLRREAQQSAAELIPAIFIDMFGEPATNPRGWPTRPLSEVAEVISGVAKGRKFADGEGIEVPYMRVANVKDGYLDLSEVKSIEIKRSEVEKLLIRPGDLLMTEGGDPDKLGRAALWSGELEGCVHQNHVFKVRANRARMLPMYLRSLAGSAYGKAYFLSVAKKTTGIASINKTQLSAFPVVLPPLEHQAQFDERARAVEAISRQQANAQAKASAVFAALLAHSFRGA
jgi:type I restriction enzyme, S subunit